MGFLTYDSRQYAPDERFTVWRDLYGQRILGLNFDNLRYSFSGLVHFAAMPTLSFVKGVISPVRFNRTRSLLADGSNDPVLILSVSDDVEISEGAVNFTVRRGEGVVLRTSRPTVLTASNGGRHMVFRLEQRTAAMIDRCRDEGHLHRIPASMPALGLIQTYAASAITREVLRDPKLSGLVAGHVTDLLIAAIAGTREANEAAERGAARAARLHAIRKDIGLALSNPDLTLQSIASHHGLAPRYVQRLFEQEGTNFSAYLLAQRLEAAQRALSRPDARKISTIAMDCGFSDLSWFNRAFRQRFGETPSDMRQREAGLNGRSGSST